MPDHPLNCARERWWIMGSIPPASISFLLELATAAIFRGAAVPIGQVPAHTLAEGFGVDAVQARLRAVQIRPTPPSLITSTEPFLHCCETWHVLAARGEFIQNQPKQEATWEAIAGMQRDLLKPLEERYGLVSLTYGFAGPQLVKAIVKRAAEGGWLPQHLPERRPARRL